MRQLVLLIALGIPAFCQAPKPPKPPKPEIPKTPHEQAKSDFEHAHPCPSSGKNSGACPGFVVGYIRQLACGGTDTAANMTWQTPEDARAAKKAPCSGAPAAAPSGR